MKHMGTPMMTIVLCLNYITNCVKLLHENKEKQLFGDVSYFECIVLHSSLWFINKI